MQLIERGFRVPARAPARVRMAGFTLLEVMVALVITAIGLLGIAKIQALAYASTGTASVRSLVALQASGLAASMHADRAYWSTGAAPASITITSSGTGTNFTISDNYLNTQANTATFCQSGGGGAPCSVAQMASYDLRTWATAMNAPGMLGNLNPYTTITCPVLPAPITCTIQITWNERAVSINNQGTANTQVATNSTANGSGTFNPTYILYVEP
jgi:type IV pilus assembly protein PilV